MNFWVQYSTIFIKLKLMFSCCMGEIKTIVYLICCLHSSLSKFLQKRRNFVYCSCDGRLCWCTYVYEKRTICFKFQLETDPKIRTFKVKFIAHLFLSHFTKIILIRHLAEDGTMPIN